jgi:hypothetical protein
VENGGLSVRGLRDMTTLDDLATFSANIYDEGELREKGFETIVTKEIKDVKYALLLNSSSHDLTVVFRGTNSLAQLVVTDILKFSPQRIVLGGWRGYVHRGFADVWDSGGLGQAVREDVYAAIDRFPQIKSINSTGHSLGGALAGFLTLSTRTGMFGQGFKNTASMVSFGAPHWSYSDTPELPKTNALEIRFKNDPVNTITAGVLLVTPQNDVYLEISPEGYVSRLRGSHAPFAEASTIRQVEIGADGGSIFSSRAKQHSMATYKLGVEEAMNAGATTIEDMVRRPATGKPTFYCLIDKVWIAIGLMLSWLLLIVALAFSLWALLCLGRTTPIIGWFWGRTLT